MAKIYDIKEVRLSRHARANKVFEDRPPVLPFVVEFYLFDPRKNNHTDSSIVSAVDEMDAFVRGTKRIERYKR